MKEMKNLADNQCRGILLFSLNNLKRLTKQLITTYKNYL